MANLEKIKNGFLIECECGAVHKVIKTDDDSIKLKSTYKKKEESKNDSRKEEPKKEESDDSIFF